MARNAIGIVYRKEFTEWVRDRRTLISTVLVPLFFFPIIMVGFTALAVVMVGKAKEETPKIMILGGEDSPQVLSGLREVKSLEIAPYRANWKEQISDKEIRAAVEIPPGFQDGLEKEDMLSRPPKGYDDENPAIEFLKLKSFIVTRTFTDAELQAKSFLKELLKTFEAMGDFVHFINRSLE